jgi:hypothetical protein
VSASSADDRLSQTFNAAPATVKYTYENMPVNGIQNPTTAIRNLTPTAPVYNIQGICVGTAENINRLPKGLYIVNGKKYVIK